MSARELARRTLSRIRRDSAYANLALDSALVRRSDLSPADRALTTELVYGVLRQRRQLDHQLQAVLHKPLGKTDPELIELLRVAAYQLFLDRVPAYAAVDAAVGEARRLRGAKAGGFVNAVLRALVRKGRAVLVDVDDDLALGGSLPDWLAERLRVEHGSEAAPLARSLLVPPALCVRVNATRASVEQVATALASQGGRWSAVSTPNTRYASGVPAAHFGASRTIRVGGPLKTRRRSWRRFCYSPSRDNGSSMRARVSEAKRRTLPS